MVAVTCISFDTTLPKETTLNSAAASQKSLLQSALGALGGDTGDVRAWWIPGRIEFLGKHTDYAGGRSLVCAVERGFVVASRPRNDASLHVRPASNTYIETAAQRIAADLRDLRPERISSHPERSEGSAVPSFRGIDIAFASNLPPAAGLSSSSALVVATWLALADANNLAIDPPERLASYLGAVENGVGTLGGSQDHTAILCSRTDSLILVNFAPPSTRIDKVIALPRDHVFVIASSGVTAVKTGNALENYNRAARRFAEKEPVRLHQLRAELEIIDASVAALEAGDLKGLGSLVDRSQRNAEELLENQVPETVMLARSARELGAVAASAFGAGFGGSVYALVPANRASDFSGEWQLRYAAAFPARAPHAAFFITRAGPPASQISASELYQ